MTQWRLPGASRRNAVIGAAVVFPLGCTLGLVACSAPAHELSSTELRAASGSDMVESPSQQVYGVDDVDVVSPGLDAAAEERMEEVDYDGSLTLSDGVITDAEFSVTLEQHPTVSFTLTEPLVLRREGGDGVPMNAVGTLTVGTYERHGTSVTLTPTFADADRAEVDVEIGSLNTVFLPSEANGYSGEAGAAPSEGLDAITARISLVVDES